MGQKIRIYLFIAIAFLLGSISFLYTNFFNVLIITGIILNFSVAKKEVIASLKEKNLFLKLPLYFILYMGVHALILKLWGAEQVKYSYTIFESLLLYFIAIPLYICSVKDLLNKKILKYSLLAFVGGVIVFNLAAFFKLAGDNLFNEPIIAIKALSASRFGGNKEIFGGHVFVEPLGLYISLAIAIVFYLGIIARGILNKIKYLLPFSLLLFFLFLTETKSAFISCGLGLLPLLILVLKGYKIKYKLGILGILVGISILLIINAPESLKGRFDIAKVEIQNVLKGDFSEGGSIVPRVALYKENFNHFNEFGICGLGVAYTNTVKNWYLESEYRINSLTDPHNSFMYFWLIGGIAGLLFVLGIFILPIWQMYKNKQFTFIILSLWITLIVVNNTTVLLSLNDAKPVILFFLSLFYFGGGVFYRQEKESCIKLKND